MDKNTKTELKNEICKKLDERIAFLKQKIQSEEHIFNSNLKSYKDELDKLLLQLEALKKYKP